MNFMRCGILLDDVLKRFPHNFQSEHQLTTYRSCIIAIWKVLLGFMILPSKLKMIQMKARFFVLNFGTDLTTSSVHCTNRDTLRKASSILCIISALMFVILDENMLFCFDILEATRASS